MPVCAKEKTVDIEKGYIQEVETNNHDTKRWIVIDSGIQYDLFIDYKEHYLRIDDEIIPYIVKEIDLPVTRATINPSTKRQFEAKIPWKGSVVLLSAAIAGVVSGGSAAGWAATIAGALTADAENIWVTFDQYDSKEKYYSNYEGMYYNKCINQNIKFYKTSVSSSNIILGPVNGNWFDPVRP